MAQLSNAGVQVTIRDGTLPSGEAADSVLNGNQGTITFDPSQMATAEANGEDPLQILYHELDHLYYESLPGFFQNMPGSITFTIGGVTYTFTTGNIPSGTPGILTNSPGEKAWEHMLIHNDLVSAFGSDRTGAVGEGLQGANNPPSNVQATANADKSVSGTSSRKLAAPSKTTKCSSTPSAREITQSTTTYKDSGLAID